MEFRGSLVRSKSFVSYLQYSLFRGLSHLGHYPLWEAPEVNFLILRGATEVIRPLLGEALTFLTYGGGQF